VFRLDTTQVKGEGLRVLGCINRVPAQHDCQSQRRANAPSTVATTVGDPGDVVLCSFLSKLASVLKVASNRTCGTKKGGWVK